MVRCLIVLAGLLSISRVQANALAVERPMNVVFFLVDDLGWRDLGCYGSDFYETPHADRLAREGTRFTDAYAACHVCSPTRASILTGRYPARLKLTDWLPGRRGFPFQRLKNALIHPHLPLEEMTLAEMLKTHGYQTMHIGKWHLGEDPYGPLQQGFDQRIPNWNKGWPKAGYHAPFELDGMPSKPGEYLTDRLTDSAVKFIHKNREKPFFLYLSHFAVHDPIQGREDFVVQYREKLNSLSENKSGESQSFLLEANPDEESPLTRGELQHLLLLDEYQTFQVLPRRTVKIKQQQDNVEFAAMVSAMDESLGRILDTLESLQLSENTVVIFFSDNGGMSAANFGNPKRVVPSERLDRAYSTSNLPLRGAKGWLYEGGIRVPLIVRWPKTQTSGRLCEVPVISTDFVPTILDMLGFSLIHQTVLDGTSFVNALQGGEMPERALFWHFPHYSNHGMQSPGGAVRLGDYKLIEYFENQTVQLFDLRRDPGEQYDLARDEPAKAARLRGILHQWRKDVDAEMMQRNPDFSTAQP